MKMRKIESEIYKVIYMFRQTPLQTSNHDWNMKYKEIDTWL